MLEGLIASGSAGKTVTIRIMVPDLDSPTSFPCQVIAAPGGTGRTWVDSPEFRNDMRRRFFEDRLSRLEQLVARVRRESNVQITCLVQTSPAPPEMKLFVINKMSVYFGYYHVVLRPFLDQEILDPQAYGYPLRGWSRRAAMRGRDDVEYHSALFEHRWEMFGRVAPPVSLPS